MGIWSSADLYSRPLWCRARKKSVFIALTLCVRDLQWFIKFKPEFGKVLNENTVQILFHISMSEDKHACIADPRNDGLSDFSKRVDLKYQLPVDYV